MGKVTCQTVMPETIDEFTAKPASSAMTSLSYRCDHKGSVVLVHSYTPPAPSSVHKKVREQMRRHL